MTTTKNHETFEERLLPMLVIAIQRDDLGSTERLPKGRPDRRRRLAVVVLAATVAAIIAGMFVIPAVGDRGVVPVRADDALRDPRGVERMLRAEGIDAEIIEVPIPSAAPGEDRNWWQWLYFDRPVNLTPVEFYLLKAYVGLENGSVLEKVDFYDPANQAEFSRKRNAGIIEIPRGVEGHLTLLVGQYNTPRGEFTVNRWSKINELAPTGALYCLGLDPDDPEALGAALKARGYRVMWIVEDPVANTSHEPTVSPPPGTVAVWAWLRDANLMDVRLVDASSPRLEEYRAAEGTYRLGETPPWEPPCN